MQLYSISQQGFNGVSLFANYTTEKGGTDEALFNAADQSLGLDHTITIYTSAAGSAGSKVSVHKSLAFICLDSQTRQALAGTDVIANSAWSDVSDDQKTSAAYAPDDEDEWVTFAATDLSGTLELDEISVGVITQALENISYLRAQNGVCNRG